MCPPGRIVVSMFPRKGGGGSVQVEDPDYDICRLVHICLCLYLTPDRTGQDRTGRGGVGDGLGAGFVYDGGGGTGGPPPPPGRRHRPSPPGGRWEPLKGRRRSGQPSVPSAPAPRSTAHRSLPLNTRHHVGPRRGETRYSVTRCSSPGQPGTRGRLGGQTGQSDLMTQSPVWVIPLSR